MPKTFTPVHLIMLIEAHTRTPCSFKETPTKAEYTRDLIEQGLVYITIGHDQLSATKYGKRKIEELLLTMQLPGA